MIYEKILEYLKECEDQGKEPVLSPHGQLGLMRAFRFLFCQYKRLKGLQLERDQWRAGIHKRCNREHYEWRLRKKVPIVCVCGSTKFKPEWEKAVLEETLAGRVVLSVGGFDHHDHLGITEDQKEALDVLHKHKIDIANEILVINKDNYIGKSTLSEIRYAQAKGKGIRFYFPLSKDWSETLGIPV
ncbi:hypothetical protein M0R72_06585 [Candidatus Pacearchaeota archaeon]|jgi:hypothetical protein|nr:hypothetical protein [Candidatus Pacearchaeota archaeon]